MHNHSYENEFNLHVNEISFSYERRAPRLALSKAKGNSEMAYSNTKHHFLSIGFFSATTTFLFSQNTSITTFFSIFNIYGKFNIR